MVSEAKARWPMGWRQEGCLARGRGSSELWAWMTRAPAVGAQDVTWGRPVRQGKTMLGSPALSPDPYVQAGGLVN